MPEKTTIPLSAFQQWMQDMLLDPYQQNSSSAQSPANALSGSHGIDSVIKDSKKLAAKEHLAIYQRSYIARLRECMAKQFSTLEYALGKELFRGFADNYLAQHPSVSYTLNNLGENFSAYLEATRPDKDDPVKEDWPDFMIEMARFEYALTNIFDEQSDEQYSMADDATPEEKLRLVPVFYLFDFEFPIHWYYSAFVTGKQPALPVAVKTYCGVIRHHHNFKLALFDLHAEQYFFLLQLKAGYTIAEAKQLLINKFNTDAAKLAAVWPVWKKHWVKAGFFRV